MPLHKPWPAQPLRIFVGAVLLFGAACQRRPTPAPAAPPAEPAAEAALAATMNKLSVPLETRPVYPVKLSGEPDPLAVTLCQALHGLPSRRRIECCGGTFGAVLTDDCVRVVTYAARERAVTIDRESVAACSRDMAAALTTCDWIGPWPPELPAACRSVLHGTLGAGARCRSSLECSGSLRCQGVSPVTFGTCGPPRPDGEACGLAVDALAAYTRQDRVDRDHPECAGSCGRRHACEPARPLGAECVLDSQCGSAGRCGAGRCIDGAFGGLAEACSADDCAPGLRCHEFRCIKPKPASTGCTDDGECLGGCVRPGEATAPLGSPPAGPGRCAAKCSLAR